LLSFKTIYEIEWQGIYFSTQARSINGQRAFRARIKTVYGILVYEK